MKLILFLLTLLLFVRVFIFYNGQDTIIINKSKNDGKASVFTGIKGKISDTFYKTLPQDHSALILGIVLGEKGNFNKDYFEAIRKTGTMHIIAASGMNVSMLTSFLLALLVLFLTRQAALVSTAVAIFLYAGLAEFEPSIVRASIMAVFAFGAGILGRQNTALLALFLAGFLMLLFDPALLEDIGFQLSYAATAGIIILDPLFKSLGKNLLFEDLRTTLSAQLATVPLLIFFFGSYSPAALISNLLILWTVPPLMVLGGVASLASLVSPILALPFLWLSLPLLMYFKFIVMLISGFAPEFNFESVPLAIIMGYYFMALSVIALVYKLKKIRV